MRCARCREEITSDLAVIVTTAHVSKEIAQGTFCRDCFLLFVGVGTWIDLRRHLHVIERGQLVMAPAGRLFDQ